VRKFHHDVYACCAAVQADRDEARNQHAAAVTELEALSQQLAAASTGKSQAEAAAQELQAAHDALTAQQAALQAQVCKLHTCTTRLHNTQSDVQQLLQCQCSIEESMQAWHAQQG
jgi:chromosome segregation ATPase